MSLPHPRIALLRGTHTIAHEQRGVKGTFSRITGAAQTTQSSRLACVFDALPGPPALWPRWVSCGVASMISATKGPLNEAGSAHFVVAEFSRKQVRRLVYDESPATVLLVVPWVGWGRESQWMTLKLVSLTRLRALTVLPRSKHGAHGLYCTSLLVSSTACSGFYAPPKRRPHDRFMSGPWIKEQRSTERSKERAADQISRTMSLFSTTRGLRHMLVHDCASHSYQHSKPSIRKKPRWGGEEGVVRSVPC